MLNTDVMDQVAAVGSKLAKQDLLAKLDKSSLKFLRWALDPAITFGVIVDGESLMLGWGNPDVRDMIARGQMSKEEAKAFRESWWDDFDSICRSLSRRELTGNAATEHIRRVMEDAHSGDDVLWACRILNKDLRAGFSVSTLNKAHPGCLEPFAVALAKPYEPDKHEIRGAWCVEPKLDGLRMVVIGGQAFTRNGREIESVGHIIQMLEPWKDEFVFDGEIMGDAEFNEDSGNIRRKGEGANLTLKYNMFDCIRIEQWKARKTDPYLERRANLCGVVSQMIPNACIRLVESRNLKTDPTSEELFALRDYYIGKGFEGAMIKNLDAPYVFKRSDNILKLKTMLDADGEVVGWYEGKGRHKGRLGGLVALFDGVETRVGSGFSDEQRTQIWKEGLPKGRVIEVQYQNKTPDGSLRFPVFIKYRPDKE